MGDVLTVVIPLLLVGVAFTVAARFEQRIPTRLKVYRFHRILYPGTVALSLLASALMKVSTDIDWWLNDATILLNLIFGITGVVVCVMLAPGVWWLERQPDSAKAWRIGRPALTTVTVLPYLLIFLILLFYHE